MLSGVAQVEVETQSDGTLLVRWAVEGEPVAVDVAIGDTPEHVDHEHEATVPAGQSILQYARESDGAKSYRLLAAAVLENHRVQDQKQTG